MGRNMMGLRAATWSFEKYIVRGIRFQNASRNDLYSGVSVCKTLALR
jgi:hypothetical protein